MKIEAPLTVKHGDMRRYWWITYKWVTTQAVGYEQPLYLRAGFRPINEAKEAGQEWDISWRATRACVVINELPEL